MKSKIVCVVGTRPEVIKMAPVILGLRKQSWADVIVVATAQHRELADDVFELFGIVPDVDLNLMQANQTLSALTSRAITGLDALFDQISPAMVIAEGDTTSVMAAALVCFYRQIPFLHVEAGLRSFDLQNPFPEEFNRIVASRLARLHFAPTEGARQNLLNEGVPDDTIYVTGNTVIDALLATADQDVGVPAPLDAGRRLVLVTVHRRENFGQPILSICGALKSLLEEFPDIEILWPVHPNPNVHSVVHAQFDGVSRVHLVEPLAYGPFISAMKRAYIILTDSGGVQEEAPALGRPVLVLRRETERPEAVEAGVVHLIGTETASIIAHARELLSDPAAYARMARGISPYGDGLATGRIIQVIADKMLPEPNSQPDPKSGRS